MCLKMCLLAMVLATSQFAQIPEKQTGADLSARELYYQEPQANDALPSLSSGGGGGAAQTVQQPAKRKKGTTGTTSTMSKPTKSKSSTYSSSRTDNPINRPEPPLSPAAIPVVEHLGLRYSLLLVNKAADKDTTSSQPVDPDRVFHNGDCLALELEPNRTGYLYVLAKGENGNYDPLFPGPGMQDESETVYGRTKQRVPLHYCFELDEHPGEEHLYLILSRSPAQVADLHNAVYRRDSALDGGAAAKVSSKLVADAAEFNKQATNTVTDLASRGFKISKISAPEDGRPEYSVYVVPAKSEKKDTVFVDIRINHH
jgi:Domain of unknown function (DUF4384)